MSSLSSIVMVVVVAAAALTVAVAVAVAAAVVAGVAVAVTVTDALQTTQVSSIPDLQQFCILVAGLAVW